MKKTLLQMLLANRATPGGSIKLRAPEVVGEETIIFLYDPIVGDRWEAEYFGAICAQDLVPLIDGITTPKVRLRLNCPGGDVFAMQAIMNAIRQSKATFVAQVDGVAASAATGIACVCSETVMGKGSLFMIHNAQGIGFGDKNEMIALADLMDKVDQGIVEAYAERTGQEPEALAAMMDAETWFTAAEAVEAGFATGIMVDAEKAAPAASAERWDLSAFQNAPVAQRAEPEAHVAPIAEPEPASEPEDQTPRLRQRLRAALLCAPSPAPSRK